MPVHSVSKPLVESYQNHCSTRRNLSIGQKAHTTLSRSYFHALLLISPESVQDVFLVYFDLFS
jgi:hypothetical protein